MDDQIDVTPNDTFVPKYYEMDPETDDIVPAGEDLKVGMTVLIENCTKRIDIDPAVGLMSAGELHEARKWNRWGTVATSPKSLANAEVSFILEYDDGSKKQIITPGYYAWFVKKDSIPEPDRENLEPIWENPGGMTSRPVVKNYDGGISAFNAWRQEQR